MGIDISTVVENLLYRRQFIILDNLASVKVFDNWVKKDIGKRYLYAHPELEVTTIKTAENTFCLLGFIIDSENISDTNADILSKMANLHFSVNTISDYLFHFSGRFVLLIQTQSDLYIFHDPCGLRSVFYTNKNGNTYIGSDPNIFGTCFELKYSKHSFDYLESDHCKKDREHWMPSGVSLFEDIYRLTPNHYLQVSCLKEVRYYPTKDINPFDVDEVVIKYAKRLSNSLKAISNRNKLALPLTAGLDSRLLLAASKDINESIFYYTLKYRDLTEKSFDIKIPVMLSKALDLNYHIIDCTLEPTEEFIKVYNKNTALVHTNDWCKIAYGIFSAYPYEKVCVKGNCSEISRCFYYPTGRHEAVSLDYILSLVEGWSYIPFIKTRMNKWFEETVSLCTGGDSGIIGFDILDLFYWEHRMGSWQSQSQLEWDISQEAFTPYNDRQLIEWMSSTPTRFRCKPDYIIYKKIIEHLWPGTIKIPINPSTIKEILKDSLKKLLNTIGLFNLVNKIYKKIK